MLLERKGTILANNDICSLHYVCLAIRTHNMSIIKNCNMNIVAIWVRMTQSIK